MKNFSSASVLAPPARGLSLAGGMLAAALMFGALSLTMSAQPGPPRRDEPLPRRDLRVVIENTRSSPRFLEGPRREEFVFVREAPRGILIDRRETLLDLLLRPAVRSLAWGLGDLTSVELAAALGLPVHTTLYAVEPGMTVVSSVPPGYFVAEALPQNVALVSTGSRGEPVVRVRRVPPGAVIAYQSSPSGVVLNECIVVPPVQQVVLMAETAPPAPVVYASGGPAPTAAQAPASGPQPAVPVAAGKTSAVVYDANHNPIGVVVTDPDGKKEFVPLQ
jgi:hypothetical protein